MPIKINTTNGSITITGEDGTGNANVTFPRAGYVQPGANSNITSLTGLTTALSVAQGGTGDTAATGARSNLGVQISGKGADVASATALTLGTDGDSFDITGTTTITSIGTLGIGTVVSLQFDGILTLTHQAADLILPGGANITTAAGDIAVFVEYATGDWRCLTYTKASEAPGSRAASGSNSDITAITGLTTDLSIAQGGTGAGTASAARTALGVRVSAKGADIASATALSLGSDGDSFDVTGTTTITSIGTVSVGMVVTLQFDGILTLTHSATDLILPGGADITTAAGDIATFVEYATGDWRCVSYQVAASAPGGGGGAGYFLGNSSGATGDTTSGLEDIFRVNSATVDNSCTIAANTNASCTGPLTVSSGVVIIVSGVLAVI